jgi:SAM-dependent methyltransferase
MFSSNASWDDDSGNDDLYRSLFSEKIISKSKSKSERSLKQKSSLEKTINKKKAVTKDAKSDQIITIHKLSSQSKAAKKLSGAKFRMINERLYTCTGSEAMKLFTGDSSLFSTYHEGFREQVSHWPLNPLDELIEYALTLPSHYVIADFGCGEGRLSLKVPHKVHSFDFVSVGDHVTSCDMSHVPLDDSSIDVGVYCLSLMGVNLTDYIKECRRVLRIGGILKIYEIRSRIKSIDGFIDGLESFGFHLKQNKVLNKMFVDLEFILEDKRKLPSSYLIKNVILEPCLYKKR